MTKKYLDNHWLSDILKGMTPDDLKKWRADHGYTQQTLGDALGVTKVTVGRWETDMRHIPSFLHLALRCLELEGGDKKVRDTKKGKEKGR
jgi:DNA-binding XRE family transcriptional regulator